MRSATIRLTNETTMWKAWIGFNASHSLGAMFFGLMYGYFIVSDFVLFGSTYFIQAVGLLVLCSYYVLAKLYWFKIPRRGIAMALFLYVAGLLLMFLSY